MKIQRLPWVTVLFLVANLGVAIYLITRPLAGESAPLAAFSFSVARPTFSGAFASLFAHLSLIHLLGNLLFLAVLGTAVEAATSWWRYALVYLGGGLSGVCAHYMAFRADAEPVPLLGASACVAACIGYAGLRFARMKVPLVPRLLVPAWFLIALWVATQFAGLIVARGPGTAFAAHVGGLVFGVLIGFVFVAPNEARLEEAYAQMETATERSPAAGLVAARKVVRSAPRDVRSWMAMGEAGQLAGDDAAEREAWQQVLELGTVEQRGAAIDRLDALGALASIPSPKRMRWTAGASSETQILLARSVVSGAKNDPERPQALLLLAELEPSRGWASMLVDEFPLDPLVQVARQRGLV